MILTIASCFWCGTVCSGFGVHGPFDGRVIVTVMWWFFLVFSDFCVCFVFVHWGGLGCFPGGGIIVGAILFIDVPRLCVCGFTVVTILALKLYLIFESPLISSSSPASE